MSELKEYLIEGDDLTAAQLDRMGQAVLRAIQGDAVRFQTDIPELKPTDPFAVHAAADVLRTAAGKTSEKDRQYAMTGWLDATDPELWDAYVTFMPWSIDGDVWDGDGRQIVNVDDGAVTTVAVASARLPDIASIVGPERLTPWLEVKAERRVERRRWLSRHPDVLIGWLVVALGLLLIPLPGPGWLLLAAGALLLVAGATVRSIVGRPRA
ncbi:MAG: PGPGW domain-containing protein [Dermatophilaceae bacterium]